MTRNGASRLRQLSGNGATGHSGSTDQRPPLRASWIHCLAELGYSNRLPCVCTNYYSANHPKCSASKDTNHHWYEIDLRGYNAAEYSPGDCDYACYDHKWWHYLSPINQ